MLNDSYESKKIDCSSNHDSESRRYLCDFSDGEHGHELFAWQHRYYGSDASVHLGTSRPSLFGSSGNVKASKNKASSAHNATAEDITFRLSTNIAKLSTEESSENKSSSFDSCIALLRDAYKNVEGEVGAELKGVFASLCVLYSRKLVMNFVVSSQKFNILSFTPSSSTISSPWSSADNPELAVSRCLWQVIECCTSLSSSGWVGEAGAMAVAAEAIGLGISTSDNKSNSIPAGMCSASKNNEQVLLLCGGSTQFLGSALSPKDVASKGLACSTFAACSENAIGSDSGGSLPFLRSSLQHAIVSSAPFRQILLASVRKAVRLLGK